MIQEIVKESFSIWLKHENMNDSNYQDLLTKYDDFEASTWINLKQQHNLTKKTLSNNVYFYIRSGVNYIRSRNYESASKQFEKAINIDEKLSTFAYLNQAVANNELNKVQAAIEGLRKTTTKIQEIINQQVQLRNMVRYYPNISSKFDRKIDLMNLTLRSVHDTIGSLLTNNSQGKRSTIIYHNWINNYVSCPSSILYKKDGTEIVQIGWIGPIKVKERSFANWPMMEFIMDAVKRKVANAWNFFSNGIHKIFDSSAHRPSNL